MTTGGDYWVTGDTDPQRVGLERQREATGAREPTSSPRVRSADMAIDTPVSSAAWPLGVKLSAGVP